jgi:hypothetical protein
MRCNNCLSEGEEVFAVLSGKYFSCPKCSVTYAKDRTGEAFLLNEAVNLRPLYPGTNGKVFLIKGIYIMEECESGRMIHLQDKETGKPFKRILDTNWLIKIKN